MISASKIDLHTLPTELLELFSPLLCEMEEIGTTLDRDEFIDASIRLLNVSKPILTKFDIDFDSSPEEFGIVIQESAKITD